MTEQATPTEHELNVRHHVYRIMDRHLTSGFEELDNLHKRGITDTDVITAMRHGGYTTEADAYIEWSGAVDPDLADVNNVTTNPDGVTDPGTNPSDIQRQEEERGIRHYGTVTVGGQRIELGRDDDAGYWLRSPGLLWVSVEEGSL